MSSNFSERLALLPLAGGLVRVCLLVLSLATSANAADVRIILRYDDYSSYGEESGTAQLERSLFEAVRQLGGNLIVSVIPFPGMDYPASPAEAADLPPVLGPVKRDLLRSYVRDGTVTVALHGFSHKARSTAGPPTEFGGLPDPTQAFLLRTAKVRLESVAGSEVSAFVPPFNHYDAATLTALEATGFKLLSAGFSGPSEPGSQLTFLPGPVHPHALKAKVLEALRQGHGSVLAIMTMHPYDFAESREPLPTFRNHEQVRLEDLIRDIRELVGQKGVAIASAKALIESGEDLSFARLQSNLRLQSSLVSRNHLLPSALNLYAVDGLYYQRQEADQLYRRQLLAAFCLYASFFGMCATAAHLASSRVVSRVSGARFVTLGLAPATLLVIGLRGYVAGFHLTTALLVSACLGISFGGVLPLRAFVRTRDGA
jgi:hypothetical protein